MILRDRHLYSAATGMYTTLVHVEVDEQPSAHVYFVNAVKVKLLVKVVIGRRSESELCQETVVN